MMIETQKLKKVYSQGDLGIEVLKGIDFTVDSGETVALVGSSGSGKSTLLSLLAGLDKPSTGSISIAGEDLSKLSEEALTSFRARTLSIVFQQFHLMSTLTALENVSLPMEILRISGAVEKAKSALNDVGLSHRMGHFPHQMSGGECQRVAIARAFVVEPRLLLADEPSGSLDVDTGHTVMDLLFNLVSQRKMTLVLVTHNESLAKRCHRQYALRQGILFETTAP